MPEQVDPIQERDPSKILFKETPAKNCRNTAVKEMTNLLFKFIGILAVVVLLLMGPARELDGGYVASKDLLFLFAIIVAMLGVLGLDSFYGCLCTIRLEHVVLTEEGIRVLGYLTALSGKKNYGVRWGMVTRVCSRRGFFRTQLIIEDGKGQITFDSGDLSHIKLLTIFRIMVQKTKGNPKIRVDDQLNWLKLLE